MSRSTSRESLQSEVSHAGSFEGVKINVKLPQLESLRGRFTNIKDLFRSAIHDNEAISKVDKFKYLKSYLEDQARSAIPGIHLTDNNYDTAVGLLHVVIDVTTLLLCIGPVCSSQGIYNLAKCVCDS